MRTGQLPAAFRERAEMMRECGARAQAAALEWAAEQAEAVLRGEAAEELTLAEAAAECGYSRSHLRRLVREGRLPAAGRDPRIRVLRRHLPRKPGAATLRSQLARAVVERGAPS
ncbi:MAG: helix-turn-helix domain-containing protein [Gemmatimonadetes bacterium]|nr:helix-turn-helix domain-containing protein [Gemmatimonadota bacterium]